MLHRISIIATSLLLTCAAWAQQLPKNIVDEVVWVVGDQPILLSEVEGFRIANTLSGATFKHPYGQIPEQLAIQKLYIHQAELDSIAMGESELLRMTDMRLNAFVEEAGSRENLEKAFHKTYPQIRELIKEQVRTQYVTNEVREKLTSNIKITPAEVREYFSKVPTDSLPVIPTKVEVQIIMSNPRVAKEEVERIESRLREFAQRVNKGETDFARLARMYSQDGSARNGGELGLSGRNAWVPEFANVAFSLTDPKKVSKVVKTDFGYHIIQLIEKRNDKVNVRHILLKPDVSEANVQAAVDRLDSIATDIRTQKFTFEDAAKLLSDDKDTRNNRGLMVNNLIDPETHQNLGISSKFELKDLPSEIAHIVDTLKVGEVSQAFRMLNPKTGSEVCAIIKLKSRVESHPASMTEDFQVLQNVVVAERKQQAIEKWLTQKIKSTYTRIRPEWRNEKFQYEGWVK